MHDITSSNENLMIKSKCESDVTIMKLIQVQNSELILITLESIKIVSLRLQSDTQ